MLSQMGIAIIACLAFNMLLGQGGMLSFGHAVYSGLGAFFAIHALNLVSRRHAGAAGQPDAAGRRPGAACSSPRCSATSRRKKAGTPFAMITLGMGELVAAMSLMFPGFFGGEGGITGNRVAGQPFLGITFGPQIQLYYLIAVYTFVCTAADVRLHAHAAGPHAQCRARQPRARRVRRLQHAVRALLRLHRHRASSWASPAGWRR